jgi:hypothetical protein
MLSRVPVAALTLLTLPLVAFAGGTPDPSAAPLAVDSGDADTQPDNQNQLLGLLGPDRGFAEGDYVSDASAGLARVGGPADGAYRFGIEVPPGQSNLTVELFDADIGAGSPDGTGIDPHDQNNEGSWESGVLYRLLDPDGTVIAAIALPARDCDPVTAGLQAGCDSTWSDLGVFSISNPPAGHWSFQTEMLNAGDTEDDNNAFGIRAHDGDPTAGGTEYNVYGATFVGLGHCYGASAAPANLSRNHDLYPYVTGGCSFDLNDFDVDTSGDESLVLRQPNGSPTSFAAFSGAADWNSVTVSDFTTAADASEYGLWQLRWVTGRYNFFTFWAGSEEAVDPANPAGSGNAPDANPVIGALRLYLPADGSRMFGERGESNDVIIAPTKPAVGQSFAIVSGPDPLVLGMTSRVRVTIAVDNPTAFPIQFDATTGAGRAVVAEVPTNGGISQYVTGSMQINNSSAAAGTATAVSGTGPWTLELAPGVVDAGTGITLSYDIDVTPTSISDIDLTGTGTVAVFLDETCADVAGGPSSCSAAAQVTATVQFGPLCGLSIAAAEYPVDLQHFSVE